MYLLSKVSALKSKKRSSFSRIFLRLIALLMIWGGIGVILVLLWFGHDLPSPSNLSGSIRNPSISIQTQKGEILATYGDYFDNMVSIKDLPEYVPQAILAVEDRRFYSHFGIDLIGTARAIYKNHQAKRVVAGGSTITQQLAKNFLFSQEAFSVHDRSIKRKVQEALLSLWLEWHFTKDEIFTLYLNRVYLGSGTYGIEAASQRYFDKSAKNLSVFEASIIAGLLKAPTKYCPTSHPKEAQKRATLALKLMEEAGFLKDSQKYLKEGMEQFAHHQKQYGKYTNTRFFCDWIVEQIPDYVSVNEDLSVVVTLDTKIQEAAEQSCQWGMSKFGKELKTTQVSFAAMRHDGAVLAMIGGQNYKQNQYNRVTQAKRQPGSTFKLFVYAAAMEAGMDTTDMVESGPVHIGSWHPSNYKWKESGEVSLEFAFLKSINGASIRIAQAVGPQNIISLAKKLGIRQEMKNHLSIALGAMEVTLLDLVNSAATFINKGNAVWNYGIVEIRSQKTGKILYRHRPPSPMQVLSNSGLHKMRRLLRACVERGTGKAANVFDDIGGKTGSNGSKLGDKDAWFIGYCDEEEIAAGVWTGNDDGKSMSRNSGGGRLPAHVFGDFFKRIDQKDISKEQEDPKKSKDEGDNIVIDQAFEGM